MKRPLFFLPLITQNPLVSGYFHGRLTPNYLESLSLREIFSDETLCNKNKLINIACNCKLELKIDTNIPL